MALGYRYLYGYGDNVSQDCERALLFYKVMDGWMDDHHTYLPTLPTYLPTYLLTPGCCHDGH